MEYNLLVPGGLGFIGSHTIIELILRTSAKIIIVDDMSNCYDDVLGRMYEILLKDKSKQELDSRIEFHQVDIMKVEELETIFKKKQESGNPIMGIMHFAAKKAIGESMK